ncbi:hypothetical protein GGX14DRAFT_385125 [Mycena pura]|uniref:Uncharacterized protein n=1 Tax=Mycena pura TaxID=153505 RepID=A0AAD7E5G8_9AGAR|nr:hypothetical protein GGX14DRAFT_385125 [Mycena pura]
MSLTTQHPFLVSTKSQNQNRDFFIFGFESRCRIVYMLAGLNLERNPLTIKALFRWLMTMPEGNHDYEPREVDFVLRRVSITRMDVLRYLADPVLGPGTVLTHESEGSLEPGYFAIYDLVDKPSLCDVGCSENAEDFLESLETLEDLELPIPPENELTQDLVELVSKRDHGVCLLTGSADVQTCAVWIFQPVMATALKGKAVMEDYRTPANIITVWVGLVEMLNKNLITVDREDNNRIVTFEDIKLLEGMSLRASLSSPTAPSKVIGSGGPSSGSSNFPAFSYFLDLFWRFLLIPSIFLFIIHPSWGSSSGGSSAGSSSGGSSPPGGGPPAGYSSGGSCVGSSSSSPPSSPGLTPHDSPLSAITSFSATGIDFWRLHFAWSLRVQVGGGDASQEYADMEALCLMDELKDSVYDATCLDPSDKKWQTGIGAETLSVFLESYPEKRWLFFPEK